MSRYTIFVDNQLNIDPKTKTSCMLIVYKCIPSASNPQSPHWIGLIGTGGPVESLAAMVFHRTKTMRRCYVVSCGRVSQ